MLKQNDKITFLDSVGGGKVVQVDEEHHLVWIETDDGFDVGPIPMSQCVPVSSDSDYTRHGHTGNRRQDTGYRQQDTGNRIQATGIQKTDSTPCPQGREAVGHRSQRQSNELIFDLHIEALPTNGNGMTDVEKHKYQLQYFRMQMQQNIRYRGKRLIFIHGKGNGVLKNEIRQELQRNYKGKVEVHDADFSKYEEGATLVIVK